MLGVNSPWGESRGNRQLPRQGRFAGHSILRISLISFKNFEMDRDSPIPWIFQNLFIPEWNRMDRKAPMQKRPYRPGIGGIASI